MLQDLQPEIEYEFSLKPGPHQPQYVLEFEGRARAWDEAAAEEVTAGVIRGMRVDLATAADDALEQGELLETISSELADFSATVLKREDCVLPTLEEAMIESEQCEGIVYISELIVTPAYRGQGIGTALLKQMASMVDVNHCLIALKAFPLAEDGYKVRDRDEILRVKHFYRRLGFDYAEGEFMIKDARLCEAMKKRMARRRRLPRNAVPDNES